MRNVIILGGIGTKKTHIKKLIDLYTNLNLNPIFYQAEGLLGNHLYRPEKFKAKSLKIIEKIKDNKKPYIIHSFSGSNWLAYDINSHKKAQTIILESSPIIPSYNSFNNFLTINYNIKVPLNLLKLIMNISKIPTFSNKNFNKWYDINKPKNNTLILIGENDKLLDKNYINKEYILDQRICYYGCKSNIDNNNNEFSNKNEIKNKIHNKNNKLVIFNNSGHCNISKRNYDLYKKTIIDWLKY